jgi:hypothetical protein
MPARLGDRHLTISRKTVLEGGRKFGQPSNVTDMNPFLSHYCERAGLAGLFVEPLNVVTNAAFLIAAILVWRRLASDPCLSPRREWDIAALAGVVFAIGLGSAAWHAHPVTVTHLADVVPISMFILGFILAFMIRIAGLAWPWALAVAGVFLAASYGAPPLLSIRPLGGSGAYLPALVAMALVCAGMFALRHRLARIMLLALVLFSVSLGLRSVDGDLCAVLPTGTHFLWHMLNASVLYTLLRLLIASAQEDRAPAAGLRP